MKWGIAAISLIVFGIAMMVAAEVYDLAVNGLPLPPQDAHRMTAEQWREMDPPKPANTMVVGLLLSGALSLAIGVAFGWWALLRRLIRT
jgi:formate hydrogenlyase subunit 3/multisubunit Na+/H+ antiporter MnhD subunit